MKKVLESLFILVVWMGCNGSLNTNEDDLCRNIPPNAFPIIFNQYVISNGMIDSVEGSFIIDLASNQFILDSIFTCTHYLKNFKRSHSTISGVGSLIQNITEIKDSISFSLNKQNYQTANIPVVNLKSIGGDLVDGLIGTDFLKDKVLSINYIKEYACLSNDIDSMDTTGYRIIPMKIINSFYCIPLTIEIENGTHIHGYFIVDTGSPSSTLTSAIAYKHNLKNSVQRKVRYYTSYGGVGGESSGYDFYTKSITISNFCLKNTIMSFSEDTAGLFAENKCLGIVGNDVLEHFDVIFDFKNNDLYLRPNKDFNKPFRYDRFGFFYVDRTKTLGGWQVTGLVQNSQVEKLGLRIDDIILSLNGMTVDKISYHDEKDNFPQLKKVTFLVKNGTGTKTISYKLTPLL